MIAPPRSESVLIDRAEAIAGLALGELASDLDVALPQSMLRGKGWAGTLIESALGASAGSRPEPDFQLIGVELKTIPVSRTARPLESTYVCTVPLEAGASVNWPDSNIRRKLDRVLWVPVEGSRDIPLAQRRIGTACLWSPSAEEDAALEADWAELMELVTLGRVEEIRAHHGVHLQIRPKAANARARRAGVGVAGESIRTLPRGFYLRADFTAGILAARYAIPAH